MGDYSRKNNMRAYLTDATAKKNHIGGNNGGFFDKTLYCQMHRVGTVRPSCAQS